MKSTKYQKLVLSCIIVLSFALFTQTPSAKGDVSVTQHPDATFRTVETWEIKATTPSTVEPPQHDDNNPDNPYEGYLNFLKCSDTLNILDEGLEYMPIRGMLSAVSCIITAALSCVMIAAGLGIIERRRQKLKPQSVPSVVLRNYIKLSTKNMCTLATTKE
jgi:hypothetical protein